MEPHMQHTSLLITFKMIRISMRMMIMEMMMKMRMRREMKKKIYTFSFTMMVTLWEETGFLQNSQRDSSFAVRRSARSCRPR